MLKTFKAAAVVCGLFIMHGQQAHAAWQLMFAGDEIGSNASYSDSHGGMFPCRAYFEGGIHPGWTAYGKNACAFGWGGVEQDSSEYELWVNDWQPAANGNVPSNAIPFGYEKASYAPAPTLRYACQAIGPSNQLNSGKVAPDLGGCDFGYGGVEQYATSYNVLVDSSLGMVESTGGPKLTVNASASGFVGFTSTYYMYSTDGNIIQDGPLFSGEDDHGDYLTLCTANYVDGFQIGSEDPWGGGCNFSWGGQQHITYDTYVAASQNWLINGNNYYSGGQTPIDQPITYNALQYPGGLFQSAIIGGQEADGSHLYLCAALTNNIPGWPATYTPGKLSPALGGCSVAVNGKEMIVSQYQVLAETYTKPTQ